MKPCDLCENSYAPYLIRDLHGNWNVSVCSDCVESKPVTVTFEVPQLSSQYRRRCGLIEDTPCTDVPCPPWWVGAEKDDDGRFYIVLPDGTKIYNMVKQRIKTA